MASFDDDEPDLSAAVREGRARIAAASGSAVEFLASAVERWPKDAELRGLLAAALIEGGRHTDALAELQILAELSWNDANALFPVAECAALIDPEMSWKWLTRIREILDVRDFEYLEEVVLLGAELASKTGERGLRESRDLLDNLLRQDQDPEGRYSIALAHVYHLMDEPDAAAQIAREALERWPDDRELQALAGGSPVAAPIGPSSVAPKVSSISGRVAGPFAGRRRSDHG